jgi:hypothetical protein
MRRNQLPLGAGLAAAVTAFTLAIATSGSAQSGGRTVSFIAHYGGPTNFVDNPPKAHGLNPGPGDLLTATSTVFNSSGTTRVGRTSELCVGIVKRPFTMQCDFSLLTHNGALAISGAIDPTKHPWSAAVVGGTGAYAGARGTVQDTPAGPRSERLTITLAQ